MDNTHQPRMRKVFAGSYLLYQAEKLTLFASGYLLLGFAVYGAFLAAGRFVHLLVSLMRWHFANANLFLLLLPMPAVILLGLGCLACELLLAHHKMDAVEPLTRQSVAQLPTGEVLLRASREPAQAQAEVLLRAARSGPEANVEQLLRAAQGEESR